MYAQVTRLPYGQNSSLRLPRRAGEAGSWNLCAQTLVNIPGLLFDPHLGKILIFRILGTIHLASSTPSQKICYRTLMMNRTKNQEQSPTTTTTIGTKKKHWSHSYTIGASYHLCDNHSVSSSYLPGISRIVSSQHLPRLSTSLDPPLRGPRREPSKTSWTASFLRCAAYAQYTKN